MSSERFLRLPEEKRNRFLKAAWEEFTSVRFADVSINQIVRKAGISRGSFYQYFVDKDDLFAYLLEEVRNHVKEEYRRALAESGGDIFQAQLECFDRMTSQKIMLDPIMACCVKFLQKNQGVDIQKVLPTRPGQRLMDGLWDVMDLSVLRSREEEFARNVFGLLMVALGSAVMDVMCQPEGLQDFRRALIVKLEIIKNGCLAQ